MSHLAAFVSLVVAGTIAGGCSDEAAETPDEQISPIAFESSCGGSVLAVGDTFMFPSDFCFYKATESPPTDHYELAFQARSLDGDGYGIWLRGQWNGMVPTAVGVQYIPAPFGDPSLSTIDFLRYPETEASTAAFKRPLDRGWHTWKIVGDSSTVVFYLDDEQLHAVGQPPDGPLFGVRTWRGQLEVKDIVAVYRPTE